MKKLSKKQIIESLITLLKKNRLYLTKVNFQSATYKTVRESSEEEEFKVPESNDVLTIEFKPKPFIIKNKKEVR